MISKRCVVIFIHFPKVLFADNANELISAADDKTLRFWDARTGAQTQSIPLGGNIGGLELTKDEDIISIACGNKVVFYDRSK